MCTDKNLLKLIFREGYPQMNYTVCTDNNLLELYKSQLEHSFWNGHKEDDFKVLIEIIHLKNFNL